MAASEALSWAVTGISKSEALCSECGNPITRLQDIAQHSHNCLTGERHLKCRRCEQRLGEHAVAETRKRLGLHATY